MVDVPHACSRAYSVFLHSGYERSATMNSMPTQYEVSVSWFFLECLISSISFLVVFCLLYPLAKGSAYVFAPLAMFDSCNPAERWLIGVVVLRLSC